MNQTQNLASLVKHDYELEAEWKTDVSQIESDLVTENENIDDENLNLSDTESDNNPELTVKFKELQFPLQHTEDELKPYFLYLERLYHPTNQDLFLYKHYRNYPLKEESDQSVVPLPPYKRTYEYVFAGQPDFGKRTCIKPINTQLPGQKLKSIYLKIKCRDPEGKLQRLSDLVKEVEFEVGYNQRIQKYSGHFLDVWNRLHGQEMVPHSNSNGLGEIYIPLPLTFHQYEDFPLYYLKENPLCCIVEFANQPSPEVDMDMARLYLEYELPNPYLNHPGRQIQEFDLDSLDRHPMLWEKLQFTGTESLCCQFHKVHLNFSGPVKMLVWNLYYQDKEGRTYDPDFSLMVNAKLQVDGQDLTNTESACYFNSLTTRKFTKNQDGKNVSPNIFCYSWAEEPTWARPTGTFNFTDHRVILLLELIPNAFKDIPEGASVNLDVYAVSYDELVLDPKRGAGFRFN